MIPVSNASPTLPIPQDLRQTLPCPPTPWNISPELFNRIRSQPTDRPFKTCEVLSSDPEFKFILKYFMHQKPPGYGIKKVMCIHNPTHTQTFEGTLKNIEHEATNPFFAPKWQQEDLQKERTKTIYRWKKFTAQFSPIEVPSESRGKDDLFEAKVLPLWHGSTKEKCESVCSSGFTYFGKHGYSAANKGGSTDKGYFGSGIYFTNSAQYAAMYSSEGVLLLTWVSMREPYPVVSDMPHLQKCSDMQKLEGKEHYQNYNVHYIPVASIKDPEKPTNYFPCYQDQLPAWDEFVVFEKAQALPRFWIELGVDLPMPMPASLNLPLASAPEPLLPSNSTPENETEQPHVASFPKISMESVSEMRCITTLEGYSNSIWALFTANEGHSGSVIALTVLDGGILASGSHDSTIKLWDAASSKCIRTLEGHSDWVYALTTLTGGILASGSNDKTIKLWNSASGKCIRTLEGHSRSVSTLTALSKQILASGSYDSTIKLWDTASGKCIRTFIGQDSVSSITILPGEILASGSPECTIKLWDIASGKSIRTLKGHPNWVSALTTLSGEILASGSWDKTIKIWDTASCKCIRTLEGHSGCVYALTVLEGGILASGSDDKTIKLWDIASGKCLRTLEGHTQGVHALTALPGGILASGSQDKTIKLWKA